MLLSLTPRSRKNNYGVEVLPVSQIHKRVLMGSCDEQVRGDMLVEQVGWIIYGSRGSFRVCTDCV